MQAEKLKKKSWNAKRLPIAEMDRVRLCSIVHFVQKQATYGQWRSLGWLK